MTNHVLIAAQQITRTYHTDEVATTVLQPTDLSVTAGEFIAIMGPSGSGKSTLLHILGLLDRPTTGQYKFDGQRTDHLDEVQLAHLRNQAFGFVFQAFYLLGRASVLDNVMLPLQYSKSNSRHHLALAREAIEKVGLKDRISHTPSQLSGGEKQRTAIARALVTKPQILMADEPTGNLDSKSGATIMSLVEELHANGMTVIVITHEHSIAKYARRTIRIVDGQIVSDKSQPSTHAHAEP